MKTPPCVPRSAGRTTVRHAAGHQGAWDARERGAALEGEWKALFAAYAKAYPDLAAEFERRMSGTLPADWESVSSSAIARFDADKPKVATRIATATS